MLRGTELPLSLGLYDHVEERDGAEGGAVTTENPPDEGAGMDSVPLTPAPALHYGGIWDELIN